MDAVAFVVVLLPPTSLPVGAIGNLVSSVSASFGKPGFFVVVSSFVVVLFFSV